MAEKYIKIRGKLIAVTEEVYYVYYHMERQRRTQAEKDRRQRVSSYDALDTSECLGVDLLVDKLAPTVEETAISHALANQLHHCIAQLPTLERKIIYALFFEAMSERKAAKALGMPHMTVHNRKISALKRLKQMMEK